MRRLPLIPAGLDNHSEDDRKGLPMSVVVTQVAVVVRDLETAMDAYHRVFGWGPWRVYDFNQLPHSSTSVRGRPVAYTMRTAVTNVGGLDLELVEPGEGPSQYKEFLAEKGEGLHHIMCQDRTGASVADRLRGFDPLMAGSVGNGAARYAYHDGGAALGGLVVETMDKGTNSAELAPSYLYSPSESGD